jgi:hypothetical protein
MFRIAIGVRRPTRELKTDYQEPLETDYIQATANKIVPNADSLITQTATCFANKLVIHKRAALSE